MTDLPKLRAAARRAEDAFEAALIAHYGREAAAYARFFARQDMPDHLAALAASHLAATDRLMAALHASAAEGT